MNIVQLKRITALVIISTGIIISNALAGEEITEALQNAQDILHYNPTKARKELGYELRLMYFNKQSEDQSSYPTIYFHGIRSSAQHFYSKLNRQAMASEDLPSILSYPAIFFDFPDAELTKTIFAFRKSSFGQWPDIAPAIYVLKTCYQAGLKRVDLFGYSRGGATTLNTIAVLNSKQYQSQLHAMGIDEETRTGILEMIQCGCITLDSPLKDVQNACAQVLTDFINNVMLKATKKMLLKINRRYSLTSGAENPQDPSTGEAHKTAQRESSVTRAASRLTQLTKLAYKRIIGLLSNYILLPLISQYKPWKEQGLYSASKLGPLKLNILIHYELNDSIVSNCDDTLLLEELKKNHQESIICFISNDSLDLNNQPCEPHFAQRLLLPAILKAFKEKIKNLHETAEPQDVDTLII